MNTQDIKKIIEMFDASNSVKLKITDDNFEISLEKSEDKYFEHKTVNKSHIALVDNIIKENINNTVTSIPVPVNNTLDIKDTIKSPMVGTFYRAPSPDSPPYVNVGDVVKKGQVVAIIEAMKIMNEIEAEFDCKIIEILLADAKSVEFDTPLFVVEKV